MEEKIMSEHTEKQGTEALLREEPKVQKSERKVRGKSENKRGDFRKSVGNANCFRKSDSTKKNAVNLVETSATDQTSICFTENSSETVETRSEEKTETMEMSAEELLNCKEKENPPTEEEQIEIIGVRFKQSGKLYFFDPKGVVYSRYAHVIVETANGMEYGTVAVPNRMIGVSKVVMPLRGVLRIANVEDEKLRRENDNIEVDAFNTCVSCIADYGLDMKLVDVEYAFDRGKLLFYFTSEERVDFRDLVKKLASVYHTRIEMRQIGIRDEAKMLGGLGACGRPFCCSTFLGDFTQVSIKMAKEQGLSLNSAKISGTCGRLMCCLRYEHETYEEELKRTPKVDSLVETKDGTGIVVDAHPLTGLVKVRLDEQQDSLHVYPREEIKVVGHSRGASKKLGTEDKVSKANSRFKNGKAQAGIGGNETNAQQEDKNLQSNEKNEKNH